MIKELVHKFNKRFRSDIYFGSDLYMKRWRFGRRDTPGFHVHHIKRSDGDREFHDHPCWFFSIVLKGAYLEIRPNAEPTYRGAGSVAFRSSVDLHRVVLVDEEEGCWTVFIRGPKKRKWGFVRCDPFVPWTAFVDARVDGLKVRGTPGEYAAESSVGFDRR